MVDGDFLGTPLLPAECSTGVDSAASAGLVGRWIAGSTLNFVDLNMDGVNDCHTHHGHLDAAADGSVRAFASGAVAQHFTRSLNRIPGADFRRATVAELEALEAFQRWLGRRPLTSEENAAQGTMNATEFNILKLDFKDARVARAVITSASDDSATMQQMSPRWRRPRRWRQRKQQHHHNCRVGR